MDIGMDVIVDGRDRGRTLTGTVKARHQMVEDHTLELDERCHEQEGSSPKNSTKIIRMEDWPDGVQEKGETSAGSCNLV